jgi:uncharacterized membrane protein YgcG
MDVIPNREPESRLGAGDGRSGMAWPRELVLAAVSGLLGMPAMAGELAAFRGSSPAEELGRDWLPRIGVFLMAMAILGFLGFAALFLPPAGAWFIYLFLMPFFVWLPGMTLHPAAGWVICGAWLVAFPALRWWMRNTPSGRRWRRRQSRRWARFDGGEPGSASWSWRGSTSSRGSSGRSHAGGSSGLSGRGGRFGGGGASGRW